MSLSLSILSEDAMSLKSVLNDSVDLVIAYPPFFGPDSERYGGDSTKQLNFTDTPEKMLKSLNKVSKEMIRVLKPGGHLIITNGLSNFIDIKYLMATLKIKELSYVDTIFHSFFDHLTEKELQFEKIYSESLASWHHFIKGKEMKYYNPFELKKHRDPVWKFPANNMQSDVDKKMEQAGYFVLDAVNEDLVKNFISIFSKSGDTILAPFGGSGVIAVKSLQMGRNAITNDVSLSQASLVRERMILSGLGEYLDK